MDPTAPIQHFATGEPGEAKTHSHLGLASLLIALGFPFLMLLLFLMLVLLQVRIENEAFTYFLMILGGAVAGTIAHLVGVIMAIAGARKRGNKKLLSVLGIIFNAIPLLSAAIICILSVAFLLHPFPLGPK